MRCRYCGQRIPEGELYCRHCGKEVRIVPDYNPLDDMLTAQIKGAIDSDGYEDEMYYSRPSRNRDAAGRSTTGRRRGNERRSTGVARNNTRNRSRQMNEDERRRRNRERARQKALRKKKKKRALLLALSLLLIIGIVGIFAYMTSYIGAVNKGNKALERNDYTEAEDCFRNAMAKDDTRPEAYTGLSKVYQAQDNTEKAERLFSDALKKQEDNIELYRACIKFYIRSEQKEKIPELLDNATSTITDELPEYVVKTPKFSLDDGEDYDDVQQLKLTAESGNKIYYTKNKKKPTTGSHKYNSPIQIEEGNTTIYAIAVNKAGIPSLPVKKSYTVELPIEDAPAVSPSTGQYSTAQEIEIKVPDGYTAYYTTDKSEPTTSSTKYTGPVEMPEGETIFKAVLVNAKGRVSGITTRNYVLN